MPVRSIDVDDPICAAPVPRCAKPEGAKAISRLRIRYVRADFGRATPDRGLHAEYVHLSPPGLTDNCGSVAAAGVADDDNLIGRWRGHDLVIGSLGFVIAIWPMNSAHSADGARLARDLIHPAGEDRRTCAVEHPDIGSGLRREDKQDEDGKQDKAGH